MPDQPPVPRIAHVIHSDGPGGGPVVVCQLLDGLQKDFDQMVFCDGEGRLTAFCETHGFDCEKVVMKGLWRWPWAILELARHFRKAKLDAVILHGQWAGPLGALAAKLAGVRCSVYIAHCPAFYHSTNLFRVIRNYIAEKIPCNLCTRVVSLSEGNYYNYLFRGWMPESHLVRIANGVDTNAIPIPADKFRQEHGFDPEARHCVYVGRLDDQKRPDWLMEAWARVQSLRESPSPAWILWVVGDGEERPVCEMLAKKLGVAESIRFVGQQPEGFSWLNAADVVVMTSLYEGHALVPLEAMACSRAVAAFFTDGITDSVQNGQTGLLCEIGDVAALGKSIAQLLRNDEERITFGRNGRRLVEEKFPLTKMISAYRSLLNGLLTVRSHD